MKASFLYTFLALFSLFGHAQAATIFEIQNGVNHYANAVTGNSGDFYDQSFSGFATSTPANPAELTAAVTGGNLRKYAWTPDAHIPTGPANAYIDMSFGRNTYNRDGADLILFFAGNATTFKDLHFENFLFSIDIDADNTIEGGLMGVTDSTSFYNQSGVIKNLPPGITAETITEQEKEELGVQFFASYALIDLDPFGYDQTTPLGDIRIYLGDSSMPALAALGAYHDSPMVVPLPLSSVLFGSGLALLSLFRRKHQS